MAKLSEYLKDSKGKPSSTRLFSYYFMWFFFISNIMILSAVLFGNVIIDINTVLLFVIYDFLLLLAIFAPKQLTKIEEIKELIAIAGINKSNVIPTIVKEEKEEND